MKVQKLALALLVAFALTLALVGCASNSTASTGSDSGSATADGGTESGSNDAAGGADTGNSGTSGNGAATGVIGIFEGVDPGQNQMRFELFEDGTFSISGDDNGTLRVEPGTWVLAGEYTFTYDNIDGGVFSGRIDAAGNLNITMGMYNYTLDRVE